MPDWIAALTAPAFSVLSAKARNPFSRWRASHFLLRKESNPRKLFRSKSNLPPETWPGFFDEASCLVEKRRASCAPPAGSPDADVARRLHCRLHDGGHRFVGRSPGKREARTRGNQRHASSKIPGFGLWPYPGYLLAAVVAKRSRLERIVRWPLHCVPPTWRANRLLTHPRG